MALRGIPSVGPRGYVGRPTGATNLWTNGGYESGVSGVTSKEGGATPSQNATPFVGSNGATITANAGAGWHYAGMGIAVSAGSRYTFSTFAKAGTENFIMLTDRGMATTVAAVYNLSNGTVGNARGAAGANVSASIVDVGDGWYRCILTYTADYNGPNSTYSIGYGPTTGSSTEYYTAAGTETVFVDGTQYELGSAATPYIDTNGGTASRDELKVVAP